MTNERKSEIDRPNVAKLSRAEWLKRYDLLAAEAMARKSVEAAKRALAEFDLRMGLKRPDPFDSDPMQMAS